MRRSERVRSPALARLLSSLLLPQSGREVIQGDLEELFRWRVRTRGVSAARRWYWRASVASVGATLLRSRGSHEGAGPKRNRFRGGGMLSGFGMDIRFAWRSLWRRPGFTALAVLTLAIGIGANTTVFAMANQVLFRPVAGVHDAGGAAFVELLDAQDRPTGLSPVNFAELRESATLFEGLAGFGLTSLHVSGADAQPLEARAQTITGDYFEALGVRPAVGRLFGAEETTRRADPSLVVISERLWGSLFGRAPDVVGRPIRANGHTLTVIGVVGGGFAGPWRGLEVDAWLPLSALTTVVGFPPERLESRSATMVRDFVARLKPGVSTAAAESQLRTLTQQLAQAYPEPNEYLNNIVPRVYPGIAVRPLIRERTYSTVRLLLAVVGLVLVIACANVMNLLLLRGVRRRGETAVRRALGASRRRVAFQLLSESMLLALLGGVAGVLVAYGLAELFRGATLVRLPPFEGLAPDVRVLGFASAAVLATGVFAGSIPALLASRADFSRALGEAGRRATAAGRALRSLMTVVQLALSLALVVAGLLLTRTIRNLYAVDLGLDASGVVTFPVNMLPARYSDEEAAAVARRAFDALSAVPGVDGVAFDMYGPFYGSRFMGRLSRPGGEDAQPVWVEQRFATPGYFATLRIPLVAGREFRAGEWSTEAGHRIILTQALARELFGDIDPVGREVSVAPPGAERYTVVGVTGDLRMLSPQGEPDLVMFRTIAAAPIPLFTAMVRTRADGAALNEALRQALRSAAPEIPVGEPASLERKLDERIGEPRLFARLLSVVSALAVLLATIGLYGVIAWTVAERTREIGIRMALGARAASVARLVFRQAGVLTGIGIAAGLLGAFWIARLLRTHLFGIDVLDAPTYVAAVLLFAIVALAGCLAPTLAATRVDPVRALRQE